LPTLWALSTHIVAFIRKIKAPSWSIERLTSILAYFIQKSDGHPATTGAS
jgi:hypothetical protein